MNSWEAGQTGGGGGARGERERESFGLGRIVLHESKMWELHLP